MKKIALVLAIMMILSLIACTTTPSTTTPSTTTPSTTPANTTAAPTDSTTPATSSQTTPTPSDDTVIPVLTGIDENAISLFNDALTKLKSSSSFKYEMKTKMIVSMAIMDLETEETKTVSVENFGKEGTKVRATSTSTAFGMTSNDDMYCENGTVYITSENGNYKYPVEEGADLYDFLTDADPFLVVGKATGEYGGSKIVTNEDGTKTVSIQLNKETFIRLMSEEENMTEEDVAEMQSITDLTYIVTVTVNSEGLPIKASSIVRMKAAEEGVEVSNNANVEVTLSYTDVKAEAPEGYLDYKDIKEVDSDDEE